MKKYTTIILFLIFTQGLFAQDTFFGISNGDYQYSNPAYTGTSGEIRFNNIFKSQFSILSGNYNTNFLSADVYKNNQGFGAYFLADQSGVASVRKIEFSGMYSYMIQLRDNLGVSFGMSMGAGQSRVNFDGALFEDQLQNDFSINETSIENTDNISKEYIEISSGVLVYSDRVWLGISGHHLNKPQLYSIENKIRQNRKLGLQLGYVYNLRNTKMVNTNIKNNNQIIYSLNSVWQGDVWRSALGSKLIYNNIVGNINISNIKFLDVGIRGILLGAGINYEMFTFIYGYEFYLGNELKAGGAHEIQVLIKLQKDNKLNNFSLKRKKNIKTFCPMK